jgi:hypothetical protein
VRSCRGLVRAACREGGAGHTAWGRRCAACRAGHGVPRQGSHGADREEVGKRKTEKGKGKGK